MVDIVHVTMVVGNSPFSFVLVAVIVTWLEEAAPPTGSLSGPRVRHVQVPPILASGVGPQSSRLWTTVVTWFLVTVAIWSAYTCPRAQETMGSHKLALRNVKPCLD